MRENVFSKQDLDLQTFQIYMKKIAWPYLVDSENFGHQECNFRKKQLKWRKTYLVHKY
jgi:hypothetical protein